MRQNTGYVADTRIAISLLLCVIAMDARQYRPSLFSVHLSRELMKMSAAAAKQQCIASHTALMKHVFCCSGPGN